MVSKEDGLESFPPRDGWRRLGIWMLVGSAIATSFGAMVSWCSQSTAGVTRRETLRAFVEDFRTAKRYPVFRACRLVHSLTEHRVDRRIDLSENWIQWTLGQFYPPFLRTQNAARILERGQGDCSERVAVLQHLLRQSLLPTRIVGLGGHVVLETYANGKWYTADPDYGVLYVGTVDALATAEPGYLAAPLLRVGCTSDSIDRYIQIFQSVGDNVPMRLNAPLSPRLHGLEAWSTFLVFALPCVLWMLSGFLWFNARRIPA